MKTTFLFILAAVMFSGGPAIADATTTAPSFGQPLVLIYPFKQLGDIKGHEWISSAMQEDLVSSLQKTEQVRTRSMSEALLSSDSSKAVEAGKTAGADLVMFGSYQVVGDQLRVNGQMIQTSTGKVAAVLQGTGITLNVFNVEDTLAAEINPALDKLYGPVPTAAPVNNQPIVTYGQTNEPQEAVAPQYVAPQYVTPQYVVPQYVEPQYVYPPYYSEPFAYGPSIIIGPSVFRGGFHRDFGFRGRVGIGGFHGTIGGFHGAVGGFHGGFGGHMGGGRR